MNRASTFRILASFAAACAAALPAAWADAPRQPSGAPAFGSAGAVACAQGQDVTVLALASSQDDATNDLAAGVGLPLWEYLQNVNQKDEGAYDQLPPDQRQKLLCDNAAGAQAAMTEGQRIFSDLYYESNNLNNLTQGNHGGDLAAAEGADRYSAGVVPGINWIKARLGETYYDALESKRHEVNSEIQQHVSNLQKHHMNDQVAAYTQNHQQLYAKLNAASNVGGSAQQQYAAGNTLFNGANQAPAGPGGAQPGAASAGAPGATSVGNGNAQAGAMVAGSANVNADNAPPPSLPTPDVPPVNYEKMGWLAGLMAGGGTLGYGLSKLGGSSDAGSDSSSPQQGADSGGAPAGDSAAAPSSADAASAPAEPTPAPAPGDSAPSNPAPATPSSGDHMTTVQEAYDILKKNTDDENQQLKDIGDD